MAQNKIYIYGRVLDFFTHELLHPATMDILTVDSVVIAKNIPSLNTATIGTTKINFYTELNRGYKQLILRFTTIGYGTEYANIKLSKSKRAEYFPFDDVFMKKGSLIELEEVDVVSTQIRMVMKGDTIIYNADAFQLSNGSMLDALIRKLPGVDLNDGRITVNGRFVSSLLLNGEKFFDGDPKIALDNLPSYMVDKVKIYEKAPEYEFITGRDSTVQLPLVVDVNLKRQYNIGWIANAETGYGTQERWLTRIFGLRFTNHSRFAVFGNMNNINDTRQPGTSGNWNPAWAAQGLCSIKNGGIELFVKDKNNIWKLNSNIKTLYENKDNTSNSSTTNFLKSGDTYKHGINELKEKDFSLSSFHEFEYKKLNKYFNIKAYADYVNTSTDLFIQESEFTSQPKEKFKGAILDSVFNRIESYFVKNALINGFSDISSSHSSRFRGKLEGEALMQISNLPDYIYIGFVGNYWKMRNKDFSHKDYIYGENNSGNNEFQNIYIRFPRTIYDVSPTIGYNYETYIGNKKFRLIPEYKFKYEHNRNTKDYYRLDRLDGWNTNENNDLGELPSSNSVMQVALDNQNSVYSLRTTATHTTSLVINYFLNDKTFLSFTPKISFQHDRLDYLKAELDTITKRNSISFGSNIGYLGKNIKLTYDYSVSRPSLVRLLGVRDESNPLVIRIGNPKLKTTKNHQFEFYRYFKNEEKLRNITLKGYYNLFENAIAQSLIYNSITGVRTYSPKNINGNWNIGGSFNIFKTLDKEQNISFSNNTGISYANSVDYTAINDAEESIRSSVRNLQLNEGISFDYHDIKIKANLQWLHAESNRPDFENINCFDFNYGISSNIELPFKLQLATDFTVYSRRGYNNKFMNDNNIIWNIRLDRAFLPGGNLVVAIEGYDILGQLSNVKHTLNTQGLVETWYNTIPHYAMLRVIYRLNVEPKKQ